MIEAGKEGRRLGLVVSGSLSHGVEVKLDGGISVEEMAVGRYVAIEGEQRRFLALVSDVGLGALDPALLSAPSDLSDPFIQQVFSGTATFGTVRVLPLLTLSGIDSPPFQPAKTIPAHFSTVQEASPRDMELVFGNEEEQRFSIGNPLDMEAKICLNLAELVKRSNGVFGKTGTGKTFLTRLLLIGILQKEVASCLVFDMHSEYGWSGKSEGPLPVKALKQFFPGRVAIFTVDQEDAHRRNVAVDWTVTIGYEEVEPEDIELLAETLNLTDLSLYAVHKLRQRWGRSWLSQFLSLAAEEVKEKAAELGEHEGTLPALKRRLDALRRLPFLVPGGVAENGENSVKRILSCLKRGMSVVLEFGRYHSPLAYILVANILTRRLHDLYRAEVEQAEGEGRVKPRPLVIVIEEAHKFLSPRLAGQTIFGTIAREMRKFQVTLLIVDQRPSGIDEEVMSQLGTKFIYQLDNDRDIDCLLSGTASRSELRAVLSRLESQRQVLILGHAVPMPVVAEVREFSPRTYQEFGYVDPAERKRKAEQDIKELWGE